MTYVYKWADEFQTVLRREGENNSVVYVPTDPLNRDYAEFLSSGATAAAYVEPEPPPEKTTEEKVNQLLSDYGLTREEMRTALDVKTSQEESK